MKLNLNQKVPEDIIKGLKILIDLGYINNYDIEDIVYFLEKPYKYFQTLENIKLCPQCEEYHEDKNKKCNFCIKENMENSEQETLKLNAHIPNSEIENDILITKQEIKEFSIKILLYPKLTTSYQEEIKKRQDFISKLKRLLELRKSKK